MGINLEESTTVDLFNHCCNLAGRALFYMQYKYREVYAGSIQHFNVNTLCEELMAIWNKREYVLLDGKYEIINEAALREQLYDWYSRFESETENQC